MEFLLTEARGREELAELFDLPGTKSRLLLDLANRAELWTLTGFDPASRKFKQFSPRRMPILPDQHDSAIIQQRQSAGTSRMSHDLTDDLDSLIFHQPFAVDIKNGAGENSLRLDQFSLQTIILSLSAIQTRVYFDAQAARRTSPVSGGAVISQDR